MREALPVLVAEQEKGLSANHKGLPIFRPFSEVQKFRLDLTRWPCRGVGLSVLIEVRIFIRTARERQ
jgi:hypothetical protein